MTQDKDCLLLLDVVYVKETLHYHGRIDFRNSVKKLNLLNVRSSRLEVFRRTPFFTEQLRWLLLKCR